jgi:hypothetical protein
MRCAHWRTSSESEAIAENASGVGRAVDERAMGGAAQAAAASTIATRPSPVRGTRTLRARGVRRADDSTGGSARGSTSRQANVWLCCGRFHKMQVGGRAVPKGTTRRGRPPAAITRPSAPTSVMPRLRCPASAWDTQGMLSFAPNPDAIALTPIDDWGVREWRKPAPGLPTRARDPEFSAPRPPPRRAHRRRCCASQSVIARRERRRNPRHGHSTDRSARRHRTPRSLLGRQSRLLPRLPRFHRRAETRPQLCEQRQAARESRKAARTHSDALRPGPRRTVGQRPARHSIRSCYPGASSA